MMHKQSLWRKRQIQKLKMKPTQEQVIAWAREAGVIECDCCLPFWPEDDQPNWEIFFERLSTLAYEAGRKDEALQRLNKAAEDMGEPL